MTTTTVVNGNDVDELLAYIDAVRADPRMA